MQRGHTCAIALKEAENLKHQQHPGMRRPQAVINVSALETICSSTVSFIPPFKLNAKQLSLTVFLSIQPAGLCYWVHKTYNRASSSFFSSPLTKPST